MKIVQSRRPLWPARHRLWPPAALGPGSPRLRLHEVDTIKTGPNKIIAEGTDWRLVNEIRRDLKA